MNNETKRRTFLKQAAFGGMGMSLMSAGSPFILMNKSPNETVTVAVMGTNSRGASLAKSFAAYKGTEVAYICDVDDAAIKKGIEGAKNGGQKKTPKGIKDFRQALDDPALDALVIAAPDHWHAPAAIMALKAGKHVYVEKPCSHNPREGELLVEAAKKYNRVVQMGNQRRSWPNVMEGIQRVKEGVIGKAYFARGWYANTRGSMGNGNKASVPEGLDYELWQGPAPRQPYVDNIIHYNWHWIWNWGTGEILNNGTHFIDLCRWALEVDYPTLVSSNGGRYAYDDDWETPDTQITTYDFDGKKTISWEGRSCNGRDIEGSAVGACFHGTEGSMVILSNDYTIYDQQDKVVDKKEEMDQSDAMDTSGPSQNLDLLHIEDFVNAIKNGNQPNSHIEDANKSVTLCQLGNIAHRTKSMLQCDPYTGKIINNDKAMALWGRDYEPGWEPKI